MSSIALLVCITIIIIFFIIDIQWKSHHSLCVWVPFIFVIIIGSRMVSQWLNLGSNIPSSDDFKEGSPIDRYFFIIMLVLGLFILFKRGINWHLIIKKNVWMFLFFYYCATSIIWSDFPEVSFKRFIKTVTNIIMILVILSEEDPFEAIKTIFRRCAYLLIPLSILFIKFFPNLGRIYHGHEGILLVTGVAGGKNILGQLCLVLGLFLFWNIISKLSLKKASIEIKKLTISCALLISVIWLFIKTNSATSLTCFIIGSFIIIVFKSIDKKNLHYMVISIILICIVAFPLSFFLSNTLVSSFVDYLGHNETFWGRTQLWSELIDMQVSPWIGAGYESFWLEDRLDQLWDIYLWHPQSAHNGYIGIYLELGIVGVSLLIILILKSFGNIIKKLMTDSDDGEFRFAFWVVVLLYNITEAAFGGVQLIWFIFLFITIEIPPLTFSKANKL